MRPRTKPRPPQRPKSRRTVVAASARFDPGRELLTVLRRLLRARPSLIPVLMHVVTALEREPLR